MTEIDDDIAELWPDDVFEALQKFRLGHLIEAPPMWFQGVASRPLWTPPDGKRPDEDGPVGGFTCPYGIITTQTCNIAERPPKGTFPWLQMSPVYRVDDLSAARDRLYLYPLTAPGLDSYVADLRLEIPLEKGALVGRAPIEAFANEDDEIAFLVVQPDRSSDPARLVPVERARGGEEAEGAIVLDGSVSRSWSAASPGRRAVDPQLSAEACETANSSNWIAVTMWRRPPLRCQASAVTNWLTHRRISSRCSVLRAASASWPSKVGAASDQVVASATTIARTSAGAAVLVICAAL